MNIPKLKFRKDVADNKRKQYTIIAYSLGVKIYFLLFIQNFLEKKLKETSRELSVWVILLLIFK
tara:strand:- start:14960 stop:15151 length:192 start_codon:yes stop_codon:yes gene_type:complete